MEYVLKNKKLDKSHFIEEIGHAMKNRPDLYCNAYMELQELYQQQGKILFLELAKGDMETLRMMLAFIITQDSGYRKSRNVEIGNN